MVDVDLPQDKDIDPRVVLKHLKPWTQYAIFVKAITLQVEEKHIYGANSDVVYIRTRPSRKSVATGAIVVCKILAMVKQPMQSLRTQRFQFNMILP